MTDTRIQLRGDTAARWTSFNPTLYPREVGVETDTLKLKVGNGTTPWTSLPYLSSGGGGGAVSSVNGATGVVVLDAADVGAVAAADGIDSILGPMTAAEFAAIGVPDPAGLYVIVG